MPKKSLTINLWGSCYIGTFVRSIKSFYFCFYFFSYFYVYIRFFFLFWYLAVCTVFCKDFHIIATINWCINLLLSILALPSTVSFFSFYSNLFLHTCLFLLPFNTVFIFYLVVFFIFPWNHFFIFFIFSFFLFFYFFIFSFFCFVLFCFFICDCRWRRRLGSIIQIRAKLKQNLRILCWVYERCIW